MFIQNNDIQKDIKKNYKVQITEFLTFLKEDKNISLNEKFILVNNKDTLKKNSLPIESPNGDDYFLILDIDKNIGIYRCDSYGLPYEGVLYDKNKNKYVGDTYPNYMPNGNGKIYFKNGNIHEGIWKNGNLINGKLIEKKTNYTKEIYFIDGKKQRKGKFLFKNGDVYEGDLSNNFQYPDGIGKYIFKNDGHSYEGEFKKAKIVGKGKYTFLNGDVYYQDIDKNVEDYIFSNGNLFIGNFNIKTRKFGSGILSTLKGDIYYCDNFDNGDINGDAICIYNNNDIYVGNFKNGKKDGYGIFEYRNDMEKKYYVGNFKDDKKCGKGKYFLKNGDVIECNFLNNSDKPIIIKKEKYNGNLDEFDIQKMKKSYLSFIKSDVKKHHYEILQSNYPKISKKYFPNNNSFLPYLNKKSDAFLGNENQKKYDNLYAINNTKSKVFLKNNVNSNNKNNYNNNLCNNVAINNIIIDNNKNILPTINTKNISFVKRHNQYNKSNNSRFYE